MPLFSSLSVRESNNHPNKLEKSPHSRRASLGTGRKASVRRGVVDEDLSTKAVAGSSSRLLDNDRDIDPMTPTSLAGDQHNQTAIDQAEMHEQAPTPPPRDHVLADPAAGHINDTDNRDSTHSASTWRENPAMKNQNTHNGVHGVTTDYDQDEHGEVHALSGDLAQDLATARKRVQAAIEAELAADRAIEVARQAVIEARSVVGAIEKQVIEEFERAHARRMETAGIMKDLEKLGRHNK